MDHRAPTGGGGLRVVGRAAAALGAIPWTTLLLILLVGVASWPVWYEHASAGLDSSWGVALSIASEHGQLFGSDIVFTYGPLGFLTVSWPWYGSPSLVPLASVGIVHFALCAVLVVGARRVVPTWQAAVLAYLAAQGIIAVPFHEGFLLLVFAGCTALLVRRSGPVSSWIVAFGGVVTAVGLLGKLNAGVVVAAVVLITTIALVRPRWRGVLILVASGAGSVLLLWLATGQSLVDFPAYATGSYEVIRGYSQAMGVDPDPSLDWLLLAYPLSVLLVARIAADGAADHDLSRKVALGLIGGILAFAFFKTGFVRWHVAIALGAVLVALFAVAGGGTVRPLFLAVFVAVFLPAIASLQRSPWVIVSPVASVRSLYHEAAIVLRPWMWADAEEATRMEIRAAYALEPPILAALRDHSVAVDPWQTAVLAGWPDLAWQPLPVFQSYSAYTSALDELNAVVLRGPDAPQRILRETTALWPGATIPVWVTIDHRNRWFEAPAAMLETFCRYDEEAASVRWEVLALTTRYCGAQEPLGTMVALPGQTVTVPVEPRPDRFVVVRVHGVDDSPLDRLITTLYRSPEWSITLNGTDPYRLVPGTAVDGLLMAVPPSVVRSAGFTFGSSIRELSIAPRAPSASGAMLSFEFLSVPLMWPR